MIAGEPLRIGQRLKAIYNKSASEYLHDAFTMAVEEAENGLRRMSYGVLDLE